MMKNTALLLASLSLLAAVPGRAGVTAGVDQTLGSDKYRGTRVHASLDIGETVYVEPSFSTYRSDSSSGSYHNFGLRLGYETGPFSLGVSGAVQPKTNGYGKVSAGADATFSLTPGGSGHGRKMAGPSSGGSDTFGAGLAAVDVGASVLHTRHRDDYQAAAAGTPRRRDSVRRATALTIGQTDLAAFAGLRFLITELSAEVVKSVYDKNLDSSNAREAQALTLSGFDAIVQGFPDTSFNAKLKWKTLPLIHPYVSYTHTTFKRGANPSNAYELGGTVGLQMLSVKAAYQRYVQKGYADQNYFTLGAGLNF